MGRGCGTRFTDGSVCSDIGAKADHVRAARRRPQSRNHTCHWPGGCDTQCPPAAWGCLKHWRKLPKRLRDKIWAAYRVGQEETMTPSREYVEVQREVKRWYDEEFL